ncbi:unnamed protein product, partial [Owenia fusiformis]
MRLLVLLILVLVCSGIHARRRKDRHGNHARRGKSPWKHSWIDDSLRDFSPSITVRTSHPLDVIGRGGESLEDFLNRLIVGIRVNHGQWYEGPNVCSSEKEENSTASEKGKEIIFHSIVKISTCDEVADTYRCITKTQVGDDITTHTKVFECCDGFERDDVTGRCSTRRATKDIMAVLHDAGAIETASALRSLDLNKLLTRGKFTIFAPKDESFKSYKPKTGIHADRNMVMVTKDDNEVINKLEQLISNHIVTGVYKTGDLLDEQILNTTNPLSTLRINIYHRPKKLITANCVPISGANKRATNGVVHVVDKVLEPVSLTLLEIISKNPQFTILKTVLSKTGISRDLRGAGQYTLFAPTDAAFRKLNRKFQDKLLSGSPCATDIVKSHLLPFVICSSVIVSKSVSRDILGQRVNLTRDDDNKLFFNDAQITRPDVMGTNGVLHVIDEVYLPEQAMDVLDVADELEASKFTELVEKAGLTKMLQDLTNFTLFLPTNEAFKKLPEGTLEDLKEDPESLAELLKYHLTKPDISCRDELTKYSSLTSLDQDNNKIHINSYKHSNFFLDNKFTYTAQCVPLSQKGHSTCGGDVHVVEKVLMPPRGDLLDILSMDKDFGTFVKMAKISGVAEMLQGESEYTIFAPTNEV